MIITFTLEELVKLFRHLYNKRVILEYKRNHSFLVKYGFQKVKRKTKGIIDIWGELPDLFSRVRPGFQEYEIIEEIYKSFEVTYIGVKDNVLTLKYNSNENINNNSLIKYLEKKFYITTDSSFIYINLNQITYLKDLFTICTVHSICSGKDTIKINFSFQ